MWVHLENLESVCSASWFQSNKALWSGLSTYPASRLSHPARKVLLQELGSKAHDPVHGVQVQCREPAGHLTGHGYLGLLGALCAAGPWGDSTVHEGPGYLLK